MGTQSANFAPFSRTRRTYASTLQILLAIDVVSVAARRKSCFSVHALNRTMLLLSRKNTSLWASNSLNLGNCDRLISLVISTQSHRYQHSQKLIAYKDARLDYTKSPKINKNYCILVLDIMYYCLVSVLLIIALLFCIWCYRIIAINDSEITLLTYS